MNISENILSSKSMYKNNHIEITLTSACNVMCSYCPQTTSIRAYRKLDHGENLSPDDLRNMSLENFKKIIKNVDFCVSKVFFTGFTEPLTNPHWFECVEYARELGYEVFLNTTLIGAAPDDIDKLLTLDVPIRIHLTDSKKTIDSSIYNLISEKYQGPVEFDYFTE
jgi:MoaA/NifB/PqqE/SkfB family radical SAM enzyme